MKENLDPSKVTDAVGLEVGKLPQDKRLHFAGSYGLALYSYPFEKLENTDECISSICLFKALIDSFAIGLHKEYQDAGKDPQVIDELFERMVKDLGKVFEDYKAKGIDGLENESDLLADMMGIGLYSTNCAMRLLNFKYYGEESWK